MNLIKPRHHLIFMKRAIGSRLKNFVIPAKAGIQFLCIGLLCGLILTGCSSSNQAPPNLNMVISVSTDGHYAIATNTNKQAILWNLKNHSYKIIFKDANIYSAYFIKHTNDFMYQNDKTNEVVVEDVDGKVIKTFNPGFPTYGEVMASNLKNWFASDVNFTVYKIDLASNKKTKLIEFFCPPDAPDAKPPKGAIVGCASVPGAGQIFALTLSPDDARLVAAADGGGTIWDAETGKTLFTINENDAQTVAAINPDGRYVVTGDIMNRAIRFNLRNPSLPYQGFFYSLPWTKKQLSLYGQGASEILAIKFIANDQLLVFRNTIPNLFNYAALYNLNDIKPVVNHPDWVFQYSVNPRVYLPLIKNPDQNLTYQKDWPIIGNQYSRDQAIDTSPSAHILVMSMAGKNGIIVYKYDPKNQTLKRKWSGVVKPSWKFW